MNGTNENAPVAVNVRKNAKWQYIELTKAFIKTMKLYTVLRWVLVALTALIALALALSLALSNSQAALLSGAGLVASAIFLLWMFIKPYIDGNRSYLESVIVNGEDAEFESRIYSDRIEYYSDDPEYCHSIPLDKVCNVFETEHLYEIQLTDTDGIVVGHMLAKDGFTQGSLQTVRKLIPVGRR